jgi:hypothetical protein
MRLASETVRHFPTVAEAASAVQVFLRDFVGESR